MTREEALQVAKPILFNTEMVRAILWEIAPKTVTRRLVQFLDNRNPNWSGYIKDGLTLYNGNNEPCSKNPPYKVGDILYVRETWCKGKITGEEEHYYYKADNNLKYHCRWYPSIHMPKEAARIFLRVTSVRVERLQDMKFKDFIAEGVGLRPEAYNDPDNAHFQAKGQYVTIWNSTIKKSDLDKYGWNANPWVWVVEFEKLEIAEKNRP